MNCQAAREIFPELLDGRTAVTAQPGARTHLANCPECQREFSALSQTLAALDAMPTPAPSPRLRTNFYAMLEEEKHSAASAQAAQHRGRRAPRLAFWSWLLAPVAAAALLLVGFFAGTRYAPVPTAPDQNAALHREIAGLKEKIDTMGQLVGYSLLQQQQQPGNDRLRGVLTSAKLESPDDAVLNDLISSLAFDASTNVRLRALEALYPHAEKPVVRTAVLVSLPREPSPLVQVAMIDFLAAARDREAAPTFEKISASDTADASVREAARRALTQL